MYHSIDEYKGLQQGEFRTDKPFLPTHINQEWTIPLMLQEPIEDAILALGKLQGMAIHVPKVLYLPALLHLKESVASSKVEGTQISLNEAMLPKEYVDKEKEKDHTEIKRHFDALRWGEDQIKKEGWPITSRFLRGLHEKLIQDPTKYPGNYRRSQNWISEGSSRIFTPPSHTEIEALMSDLEKFLNNEKIRVSKLIRIGIAHYQFETIHPFLDGNGRIGRMIIILYLIKEKLLSEPIVSFSSFCEKDKSRYYRKLQAVRSNNDLLGWLQYFLEGITEAAHSGVQLLEGVHILKEEHRKLIDQKLGRRADSAHKLHNHLFRGSFITAKEGAEVCGITLASAHKLLQALEKVDILVKWKESRRPLYYFYKDYRNLIRRM